MMRRAGLTAVSLALAVALAAAVAAWAGGGVHHRGKGPARHLTVIEHATTDATTDTGAAGDSAGDILTFANEVFNAADAQKVGTDQGSAARGVAGDPYGGTWPTPSGGARSRSRGRSSTRATARWR